MNSIQAVLTPKNSIANALHTAAYRRRRTIKMARNCFSSGWRPQRRVKSQSRQEEILAGIQLFEVMMADFVFLFKLEDCCRFFGTPVFFLSRFFTACFLCRLFRHFAAIVGQCCRILQMTGILGFKQRNSGFPNAITIHLMYANPSRGTQQCH